MSRENYVKMLDGESHSLQRDVVRIEKCATAQEHEKAHRWEDRLQFHTLLAIYQLTHHYPHFVKAEDIKGIVNIGISTRSMMFDRSFEL